MSWTDLPQSLSPFTSRTSSGNQCLSYDGDDLACGFHHQRQHHQQHHPRHQPPPGWRLPLRSAAPPLTTLPITTRSPSFRTWLRSAVSWWSRWWSKAMVLKMVCGGLCWSCFRVCFYLEGCLGIWSTPPEADYGWSYLCCHNHHCLALIEFIIQSIRNMVMVFDIEISEPPELKIWFQDAYRCAQGFVMLCDLDNPGVAIGLVAGPGLHLGGCVGVNVGRIWMSLNMWAAWGPNDGGTSLSSTSKI